METIVYPAEKKNKDETTMATIDESTLVGCPQELLERGNQTLDLPLGGFESLGITKEEFDEYPIVEFPMKLDIAPAFFISVATACKHAFPFDDDQDFYLDYISDCKGWAVRLAPSVVMYLGKSRLRIRGRTLFTTVYQYIEGLLYRLAAKEEGAVTMRATLENAGELGETLATRIRDGILPQAADDA